MARRGRPGQAWHGEAWQGSAGQGRAGEAGQGTAWQGSAGQGKAGTERKKKMVTRDILQRVYDTHGMITPALVVRDATDPGHPLHDRFEWDDSKAGPRYRELQAAQLIRSVKLALPDEPLVQVRAFVNIQPSGDALDTRGHYQPVDMALRNDLTRQRLLETMERDWLAFRAKYSHMSEYAALIQAETEKANLPTPTAEVAAVA